MNDEHDDLDWRLVTRYLSHDCTAAEAETVARWVASPVYRGELEVARLVWEAAAEVPMAHRASDAFARFATVAGLDERPGRAVRGEGQGAPTAPDRSRAMSAAFNRPRAARRTRWLMGGAALAAAVVFAVGVRPFWHNLTRVTKPTRAIAAHDFMTARAQRASIELLDGTHVVLGPASHLHVAANFGTQARVVDLTGQAYFVVMHDAKHPFVVRTATAVMQDLGTAFVVRAYPSDSVAEVAVASGEVSMRSRVDTATPPAALGRNQLGIALPSGRIAVTAVHDLAPYFGWTEGNLAFHKTPLRDVQRTLERWYGVRIDLSDSSLGNVPVSAFFDNKPVDQALQQLAQLLNVRYERHGSVARFIATPERR